MYQLRALRIVSWFAICQAIAKASSAQSGGLRATRALSNNSTTNGIETCKDNTTATFIVNGQPRYCQFLKSHPRIRNTVCQVGQPAFSICRQTCNRCVISRPTSPPTKPPTNSPKVNKVFKTTAPTTAPTIMDFFPFANQFPTAQPHHAYTKVAAASHSAPSSKPPTNAPKKVQATTAPTTAPTIMDFFPFSNQFPTAQPNHSSTKIVGATRSVPATKPPTNAPKKVRTTTAPTTAPTIMDFFPFANNFPTAPPQGLTTKNLATPPTARPTPARLS